MIPDEAVEAAASEMYKTAWPLHHSDRGGIRRILEAAAPHMLAEAIAQEYEAGADALGDGIPIYASNLRARAASIRAAK